MELYKPVYATFKRSVICPILYNKKSKVLWKFLGSLFQLLTNLYILYIITKTVLEAFRTNFIVNFGHNAVTDAVKQDTGSNWRAKCIKFNFNHKNSKYG